MANPLTEFENDYTNGMTLLDYDTIKQDGIRKRIEGLYAPEIQQLGGDAVKEGSPGGQLAYSQAKTLIDAGEFYNVIDRGYSDNHDRPIIRLRNSEGEDYTDKSYLEGVVTPDDFSDDRARELYDRGQTIRAIARAKGIPEDPNDPWAKARSERINYEKKNTVIKGLVGLPVGKTQAFNEADWASAQNAYGDFNPYSKGNVQFHTPGAKFDNTAISSFGTAWDRGWAGIGEGLDGLMSTYYDMIGDEDGWLYAEEKARANIIENQERLPYFVDRIGNVDSLSSFGSYTAGLFGQSLPYLLTIAGSAAAATLLTPAALGTVGVTTLGSAPMAIIYAGQTYNDMEGDSMDEKNASLALGIGAGMAALDMLGLKGILSGTEVLRDAAKEQIAIAYAKNGVRTIGTPGYPLTLTVPISKAEAKEAVEVAFRKGTKGIVEGAQGLVKFEMTKGMIGKQALSDAAHGFKRESVTELGQETLGYGGSVLGSNKEWDSEEYADLAINSFIGGGIAGAGITPVLSTPGAINDFRRTRRKYELAPDQDITGSGIEAETVLELENEELELEKNRKANKDRPSGEMAEQIKNDDVANEADAHNEFNKLSSKGIVQWIKDIPKNFVSRPMKWYWDSPMHKTLGNSKAGRLAQALIVKLSPTNEDVFAGEAVWNEENRFFGEVDLAVNDLLVVTSEIIGADANSKRGRVKTTAKVLEMMRSKEEGKAITPEMRAIIDTIDNAAALINRQYHQISGKKLKLTGEDLIKNRNPDKTTIRNNIEEVRRLLMEGGDKMTAKEADMIIDDLLNSREGKSVDGSSKRMSIEDVIPSNPHKRFNYNPFNVPGMEKFLSQDIFEDIRDTSREIVHTALVDKYVGVKGSKLKRMIAKIKQGVIDEGGLSAWDPKFAADMISAAEIWMGVYNPIKSDKLRGLQANITFVNLITLLGTGGPAQIPELVSAFMGRISKAQGGIGIIADLRKSAGILHEHYSTSGKQIMDKYWKESGLTPSSMWSANRRRFVKSGYSGVRYGAIGQQGFDAEEINASRLRAAIATSFVTFTGIKPMTDVARIVSEGIGNDAVFHYLDILDTFYVHGKPMTKEVREAHDMLAEVRVPPIKVLSLFKKMKDKATKKFGVDIDWTSDEVQDFVSDHTALAKYLDIARTQWVDNALANPNPGSKARATNDPHLTLLFQFRGFIITFAASVLPRLIKRATSGNPNQDVQALTILAGLVAAGFLGQMLKDEWKTEGRPYWLEDAEYVQRGFQASGLMGPFDFLLDAINPIYGERSLFSTAQGVLGPTWGNIKQVGRVAEHSLSGDWKDAQYDLLKSVPIVGHKNKFRSNPIDTLTEPFRSILGE